MLKGGFRIAAMLCALSLHSGAHAENSACWGDDSRGDISCARITERLVLSLRGQTETAVRKFMNAPGRNMENGLHFLSNYSRGTKSGSGRLNVIFEGGHATSVSGSAEDPTGRDQSFIWSAYAPPTLGAEIDRTTQNFARQPFCSDLPSSPRKCSDMTGMDAELTKAQMQGNLAKSDLLIMLNAACNPGQGLTVPDPNGDCARLRDRLR